MELDKGVTLNMECMDVELVKTKITELQVKLLDTVVSARWNPLVLERNHKAIASIELGKVKLQWTELAEYNVQNENQWKSLKVNVMNVKGNMRDAKEDIEYYENQILFLKASISQWQ